MVRELDPGRLFRRVGTGAVIVLLVLCYWNTDAWIARKNIDRLAVTGKLDARYLVRDLSLNAVLLERYADAAPERLQRLAARAERYCVVGATLREGATLSTDIAARDADGGSGIE